MVHITIAIKCTKATKIELLLAWLGPSIDLSCTNVVPNILMLPCITLQHLQLKSSAEGFFFQYGEKNPNEKAIIFGLLKQEVEIQKSPFFPKNASE